MPTWEKEKPDEAAALEILVLKEEGVEVARVIVGNPAEPLNDLQILNILVAERRAKMLSDAAIDQQVVKEYEAIKGEDAIPGSVDVVPAEEITR